MNSRQSWNIITVFLLLIFGFSIATIIKPKNAYSEKENRNLAQFPEVSAETVFSGKFEKDYEDFLTDQFIFRDSWIALKSRVQRLLGNQDINDVYYAKHDYLIEKHTGTFESSTAAANASYLKSFAEKYLPVFGKEHLSVIIVPNAVDILSDYLPPYASPYPEEEYLLNIRSGLSEGIWTDASGVLSSHHDEYIYYRTDHHWTTYAAWLVFKRWLADNNEEEALLNDYTVRTVSEEFEGTIASKVGTKTVPDEIECYEPVEMPKLKVIYNRGAKETDTLYDVSALEGRDKYAYFLGGNYGLVQMQTSIKNGRKLLVIKDSYAHCMAPLFCSRFEKVDMLDLRYFNESLSAFIEENAFTDVLFLYNAAGFAEDQSLSKLLA